MTKFLRTVSPAALGLNPCCNGRGSKTTRPSVDPLEIGVLILVVMEEGQRLESIDVASYNGKS